MSKNEAKHKKDIKFQNKRKLPIKYTLIYPGGHEHRLYICEHHLWHTKDISSKSRVWL